MFGNIFVNLKMFQIGILIQQNVKLSEKMTNKLDQCTTSCLYLMENNLWLVTKLYNLKKRKIKDISV